MIKKIFWGFLFVYFLFFVNLPVVKAEKKVKLTLFYSQYCPHCEKEKLFLEKMASKYPILEINKLEVDKSQKNQQLFKEKAQEYQISQLGVPLTIIGKNHFLGYESDETTGATIEQAIKTEISKGSSRFTNLPKNIRVPIFGNLEIANLSLPAFTVIIAALDGFNPCAMWTLMFLISLLLGMKDRRRMWILGATFIVTSGLIYFLFLSAWLNFFIFVGYSSWMRYFIGFIALGAGGYYLYDYVKNKDGVCKVTGNQKRQKMFAKLKKIATKKQFLLAFLGIIFLAIAVNMVELVCSAGLPAVYTQVLSYAKLPTLQYYGYLVLYILIFMLDDLFVFFTAMITLKTVGLDGKYARYSHLVGGILILAIGVLMLFKPEWLMFG